MPRIIKKAVFCSERMWREFVVQSTILIECFTLLNAAGQRQILDVLSCSGPSKRFALIFCANIPRFSRIVIRRIGYSTSQKLLDARYVGAYAYTNLTLKSRKIKSNKNCKADTLLRLQINATARTTPTEIDIPTLAAPDVGCCDSIYSKFIAENNRLVTHIGSSK